MRIERDINDVERLLAAAAYLERHGKQTHVEAAYVAGVAAVCRWLTDGTTHSPLIGWKVEED